MTNELKILRDFVQPQAQLTVQEWDTFLSIWELQSVKRKAVLTHVGDQEKYLYFVLEGAQRVYFISEQGKEATLIFTYSHSFGGVLDSFLLQQPSRYCYEALTPSIVLRTSHRQFTQAIAGIPALDEMIKLSIHKTLSGLLARMAELQCFSSEEKFRALLQRSPHILQLVPHKYLANYLGVDPTNFSKLMNAVKI